MKTTMAGVAVIYFALICNFYHKSNGFIYDDFYAYWKIVPMVFLVTFTLLHKIGMNLKESRISALGLAFGTVGDFMLGGSHETIVIGSIAFGLGHMAYLSLFAHKTLSLHVPTCVAVFSWAMLLFQVCIMPLVPIQPVAVGIMVIYFVLLSACLVLAASQYLMRSEKDPEEALFYRFLGFALFFVSDSSLILGATGCYIPLENIVVLGTYFTSQYFILHSFVTEAMFEKGFTNTEQNPLKTLVK